MKDWKGTRKKKCFRMLATALAFCLLLTYTNPLETLSVFAATSTAATLLKIGDYVQMGSYNGTPMVFSVVAFQQIVSHDGYGKYANPTTTTSEAIIIRRNRKAKNEAVK